MGNFRSEEISNEVEKHDNGGNQAWHNYKCFALFKVIAVALHM